MNQAPIKLGPLALLLTVISICLTTLAILTFTTAQADVRLAEKYAKTVTERSDRMSEGAAFLAEAAGAVSSGMSLSDLPDTATDEGGITWYEKENGEERIVVGVREEDGELKITSFRVTREWSEDLDIGNLWPGF